MLPSWGRAPTGEEAGDDEERVAELRLSSEFVWVVKRAAATLRWSGSTQPVAAGELIQMQ
jgi:hypothetical protein